MIGDDAADSLEAWWPRNGATCPPRGCSGGS